MAANVGNSGRSNCAPSMETRIKASLISLLAGIKAADGAVIAREMAALDQSLASAGGSLHPQLAHFLQNRSYAKALMFLGGEANIPVGVCGGRAGQSKET